MAIDLKKHLVSLKGKMYLPTYARIMAFREKHERGSIRTEIVSLDPLIVKATVYDGDGMILATGHAGAVDTGKQVWSGRAVEKAETASIGRALGAAGFGTQYALDENDASEAETGHLADSPTGSGSGNGSGRKTERDWPRIFHAVKAHYPGATDEERKAAWWADVQAMAERKDIRPSLSDDEVIKLIEAKRRIDAAFS